MTTNERVHTSGFAYEEATIPPGMTIAQYRSSRIWKRKDRLGLLGRRRSSATRVRT